MVVCISLGLGKLTGIADGVHLPDGYATEAAYIFMLDMRGTPGSVRLHIALMCHYRKWKTSSLLEPWLYTLSRSTLYNTQKMYLKVVLPFP